METNNEKKKIGRPRKNILEEVKEKNTKLGRPRNPNPTKYITCVTNIREESNDMLNILVDRSYMSRSGVIRMGIDYLFYTINDLPIPEELESRLKDLRKGNKLQTNYEN